MSMRPPADPNLVPFTFLVDHRKRDALSALAATENRSLASKLRMMVDRELEAHGVQVERMERRAA